MTPNNMHRSQESEAQTKNPLIHAVDRATRWFGNLLAPLVIITYARDAEDAFNYLMERPLLTGSFIFVFILVLAYNVLRTANIQFRGRVRKTEVSAPKTFTTPQQQGEETLSTQDVKTRDAPAEPRGRSVLRWVAIVGSLVALVLLTYAYVLVFVTGLHFVAVASAPDKASAIREVQSLNQFFEQKGRSDLEARAHASTSSGSQWYMISIGGPHTSREEAEKTFREAKEVMGPKMRSDAYIYSTENASPTRVMRNWIRGILRGIFG
jgi:hypothetical protein